MNQAERNKQFILKYYSIFSGKKKPEELIRQYVADEKLIAHGKFMEKSFPKYKLVPDEIIAAEDRVFVRFRFIGQHKGEMDGIPPTFKEVKVPFAICYRIENNKIVDHWMITDQMEFLEQLGLVSGQEQVFLDNL